MSSRRPALGYHSNFLISLIEVICKTAWLLSLLTIRLINYHSGGFRSAHCVVAYTIFYSGRRGRVFPNYFFYYYEMIPGEPTMSFISDLKFLG